MSTKNDNENKKITSRDFFGVSPAIRSEAKELPRLLTVDELADLLRVNRMTVYEAIRRREIPGVIYIRRCIRKKTHQVDFYDLGLSAFILHEYDDEEKLKIISPLISCIKKNGILLIIDLEKDDLPRLTEYLRNFLVRPFKCHDKRITPWFLSQFSEFYNLKILSCQTCIPRVSFPTINDLEHYINIFGILKGMDLPLNLQIGGNKSIKESDLLKTLSKLEFPFTDQRVFSICALQKI